MQQMSQNIFYALIVELFVGTLFWLVKEPRQRVAILLIGTLFAGGIAFFEPLRGFVLNNLSDRNITFTPTITNISPTQNSEYSIIETKYLLLDLEKYSSRGYPEDEDTLLGFSPGNHSIGEIPFHLEWTASTHCSVLPNSPEKLTFDVDIENPSTVYFLIQAGNAYKEFEGGQVGKIELIYENETVDSFPLVLGENIRDWARNNPSAVTSISSPLVFDTYNGQTTSGIEGRMDVLKLKVSQGQKKLVSLNVIDMSIDTFGQSNPCIHIPAISIEYRP